jgi:hypothetical protein
MNKTELKKINTYEQFEALCKKYRLYPVVDIGGRGGKLGVDGANLAVEVGVKEYHIPSKVGAYCNYLGGGLRGAICCTDGFENHGVPKRKAELLNAFSEMCKRVYQNVEDEDGMNDEEDEDGETNWEALGTNASRDAGIVSAY